MSVLTILLHNSLSLSLSCSPLSLSFSLFLSISLSPAIFHLIAARTWELRIRQSFPQSKKKNRADSARFVVTERWYGTGTAWAGSKGWQNPKN
jgi:hypothetical protein